MARPQSADHALKRDEILDCAAQCFAQKGYAAASMNDIAAACGTSKARLYHYYASKDAMLFDLLDAYTTQLLGVATQGTTPAAQSARSAKAQLHALIREFLSAYEHAATRHIALTSDVPFLPPASRKRIVNRQRALIHVFKTLIAQAYPKLPDALHMPRTMMLFGMMNWTFTWLKPADKRHPGRMSYAQFAEQVIVTLEGGFDRLSDSTSQ
jgi:AcrR family transcriptional regulator